MRIQVNTQYKRPPGGRGRDEGEREITQMPAPRGGKEAQWEQAEHSGLHLGAGLRVGAQTSNSERLEVSVPVQSCRTWLSCSEALGVEKRDWAFLRLRVT